MLVYYLRKLIELHPKKGYHKKICKILTFVLLTSTHYYEIVLYPILIGSCGLGVVQAPNPIHEKLVFVGTWRKVNINLKEPVSIDLV